MIEFGDLYKKLDEFPDRLVEICEQSARVIFELE